MPKEIRRARPLLEELAVNAPRLLGDNPTLAVWGMQDIAFRPQPCLPKVRAACSDLDIVELPDAKHFIQEDAPDQVIAAIATRFR